MKLANSWAEEAPTTKPSGHLYDEYDELDESKDGCGGVECWKYVLNKSHTSNKMLHELARDVRGIEKRRGKLLTVAQYKSICDKWADASRPYLRKGHDCFTEFLSKLNSVTLPKGETLVAWRSRPGFQGRFCNAAWMYAKSPSNGNLGQARQNLVLDALGKVRVGFVLAPVFKWKHRNTFLRNRLASLPVKRESPNDQHCDN
jgi:hypothetical protein